MGGAGRIPAAGRREAGERVGQPAGEGAGNLAQPGLGRSEAFGAGVSAGSLPSARAPPVGVSCRPSRGRVVRPAVVAGRGAAPGAPPPGGAEAAERRCEGVGLSNQRDVFLSLQTPFRPLCCGTLGPPRR